MPRRKAGMGDYGKERIRRNWEEIEAGKGSGNLGWLTGQYTEEELARRERFEEQIKNDNAEFVESIGAQTVIQEVDLYPDKSNYYKGPERSTRVWEHRFVLNFTDGVIPTNLGTVFVKFTNLRRRKDGSTYEGKFHGAVYMYSDVPYSVYQAFCGTNSKGQFINHTLNGYTYASLGTDTSVFTTDYKD